MKTLGLAGFSRFLAACLTSVRGKALGNRAASGLPRGHGALAGGPLGVSPRPGPIPRAGRIEPWSAAARRRFGGRDSARRPYPAVRRGARSKAEPRLRTPKRSLGTNSRSAFATFRATPSQQRPPSGGTPMPRDRKIFDQTTDYFLRSRRARRLAVTQRGFLRMSRIATTRTSTSSYS